jgi:hypothetical protein
MPFQFVELEVDPGEVKKRLKGRNEKTAETSDARIEDFEKLSAAYEPPSELPPDLIRISANDVVAETVKLAVLKLAKRQTEIETIL